MIHSVILFTHIYIVLHFELSTTLHDFMQFIFNLHNMLESAKYLTIKERLVIPNPFGWVEGSDASGFRAGGTGRSDCRPGATDIQVEGAGHVQE